jgi:hypothetical protein
VTTSGRQVLVNGQQSQTSALLQAMKANMESNQTVTTSPQQQQQQTASGDQNKQFVVTPDYIQQSMLLYQPSVIVYNPNCTTYPLQNDFVNRF